MGLKKYIISTIVLLGIIGAYAYSLNLGDYTVNIDTQVEGYILNQTLPIYAWIIAPALLLFIFSLVHMMYYGSKGYFAKQALLHDVNTIDTYVKDRILNKTSNKKLKTKEVQKVADVLNQLEINPLNEEIQTDNAELTDAVKKVCQINNGNEFVPIKSLKLNDDNEISKQNLKNRVLNDGNFAMEVLKVPTKYDESIIKTAFNVVMENKSLDKVKSVLENLTLSNEMMTKLLLKDSTASAEDRFTNSEILGYINDNNFTNDELITIAKNYKKTISPDQLIKLFEDISANNETLTTSYLYVLFEYEMIEKIREILINSQKEEFTIFKALLDLRDAGKHYSIDGLTLK